MLAQQEAERTIYLVNPRSPSARLTFGSLSYGVPMGLGVVGSMAEFTRNHAGFKEEEVAIRFINEDLRQRADPKPGDLVLISSFSQTANRAKTIIQEVNDRGAYAVVGGIHSTVAPGDFSQSGGISFQGEAGNSIVFSNLLNHWLVNGTLDQGRTVESEGLVNPKSINLAGLPVSTDVYDQLDHNMLSRGTFAVMGCPYDCDFCTVMAGSVVRTRPTEEVVEELILRGLDKTGFTLFDSNLGAARKDYLYGLLESFARLEIPRGWTVEISINLLDRGGDQLLDAFKDAHCHRLMVGFESPNTQNLETIGKKQNLAYDANRVKEIVKKAHQRGIKISGLYMVGFLTETIESIRDIEQHIIDTGLDDANIFILTPLPSTELWDQLSANGLFNPQTLNTDELDLRNLVFKHPMGNDVLLQEYKRLCDRVFSVPAVLSRSIRAFFMSWQYHLPKELRQAFISSLGWEFTQADFHRKLGFIERANKVYDAWKILSRKSN